MFETELLIASHENVISLCLLIAVCSTAKGKAEIVFYRMAQLLGRSVA